MPEDGRDIDPNFARLWPGRKLRGPQPLPTVDIVGDDGMKEKVTVNPADKADPTRTVRAKDSMGNEAKLNRSNQDLVESFAHNPPSRKTK